MSFLYFVRVIEVGSIHSGVFKMCPIEEDFF